MNEIARKAIEVHSIKTECAISHGSDVNLVFDELTVILNVIPRDGFVIAYRMFHEDQIFMCNLTQEQATNWISAPKCVRFLESVEIFARDGARETYTKLKKRRTFGVKLTKLHNVISVQLPSLLY